RREVMTEHGPTVSIAVLPLAVKRNNRRSAVASLRRTRRNRDSDLIECATEKIRAMTGRMHPPVDDRISASISDRKVLGNHAVSVTATLDPRPRFEAGRRDMIEVTVAKHVVDAIDRRRRELRIDSQRPEAILRSV